MLGTHMSWVVSGDFLRAFLDRINMYGGVWRATDHRELHGVSPLRKRNIREYM